MKKIFLSMAFLAYSFILPGCSDSSFSSLQCKASQDVPVIDQEQLNQFAREDVILMPKGDTLTIILPSDKFFKINSVTLKENKKATLNQVAGLLKTYGDVSVKILGFTDTIGSQDDNKKLSFGQAEAVLAYLWAQGLDAEHLYSVGVGGRGLVGDPRDMFSNAANRRVEIKVHAKCTSCY